MTLTDSESYSEEYHMSTLLFTTGDEQFLKFCPIFQRKSMPLSSGLNKLQICCEIQKEKKKNHMFQFSCFVKINLRMRSMWSVSSPEVFLPRMGTKTDS